MAAGRRYLAVFATVFGLNVVAGDQNIALVLPSRMYRVEFEKRATAPQNLSRLAAASATVTSPLVPWNSCGALMGAVLGIATYPHHLINGRIPAAPTTFAAKPGQRIRIRIINAGADTAYRVALAVHTMTVTHTDGFPVQPVQADAVLVGMGERYDVIVTAGDGVFPLVAAAEGKDGLARALLSTGAGRAPDVSRRPAELTRRVVTINDLRADPSVDLGALANPIALPATMTGGMNPYDWKINGKRYADTDPLTIREGQNAILAFTNQTKMWHPMHLHGHTFQVLRPDGTRGPRKDTVVVTPMNTVDVAIVADNPGTWLIHCHNAYHMDSGMMTRLDYTYA
jgi:FtsP/CotA-like multicopper oxidase with cupredoxin domain